MSVSRKQKSAVLNQTVYPHEFNSGVMIQSTDFVLINKNNHFIDDVTIKSYITKYLLKYGIADNVVQNAINGNTVTFKWKDRNANIRVTFEGESSNMVASVYVEFFSVGYIMNGYEGEKLVYRLFISHIPTEIISHKIGDHYTTNYISIADELTARITSGMLKRID